MHFDDPKMKKAQKLHEYLFRPPRPPFRYEPWMDFFANLDQKRRAGQEIDSVSLREAYEAGINGDMDSVESYLGLVDLAKED